MPLQEFLVGERAVDLGRVPEGASQVNRAEDCFLRFLIVRHPIGIGHPHAAEPNGRDVKRMAELRPPLRGDRIKTSYLTSF